MNNELITINQEPEHEVFGPGHPDFSIILDGTPAVKDSTFKPCPGCRTPELCRARNEMLRSAFSGHTEQHHGEELDAVLAFHEMRTIPSASLLHLRDQLLESLNPDVLPKRPGIEGIGRRLTFTLHFSFEMDPLDMYRQMRLTKHPGYKLEIRDIGSIGYDDVLDSPAPIANDSEYVPTDRNGKKVMKYGPVKPRGKGKVKKY